MKKAHKKVLNETVSSVIYDLLPAGNRALLAGDFKKNRERAVKESIAALGLKSSGFDQLMIELLPSSLVGAKSGKLSKGNIKAIPGIMKLYLIHNRNALTDAKFLGFPFHYFYTSQLLLIMFVLICLVYCIVTDRIHSKYGFIEDNE